MALCHFTAVFSIAIIGFAVGQDCHYRTKCGDKIETVPECSGGESTAVTCLVDFLKTCHRDKDAEKHLEKAKLQQLIVCTKNDEFKSRFKDKECWTSMDSCLIRMAAARSEFDTVNKATRNKMCKDLVEFVSNCKQEPGIKDDCKSVRNKFIDAAFEELKCAGCATITAQIFLITAATFLALWTFRH